MLEFKTLNDALLASANTDKGIWFVTGFDEEQFFSYAELLNNAKACLAALQKNGIKPGDELVLQYTSLHKLLEAYWACLLGGIVPIPLEKGEKPDSGLKVLQVWKQLTNPYLATDNEKIYDKLEEHAATFDAELDALALWHGDIVPRSFNPETFPANASDAVLPEVTEQDIAFIQFSSGSTGSPKGVALTHKNLLVNIRDLFTAYHLQPGDVFCSWKPLTHDFGMIGFNLAPVVGQSTQIRIPTDSYIWSPALWMHAANKHRAAVLGSPNFGYRHFLKLYNRRKKQEWDWDLSCVKVVINGAEPISAKLCDEFMQEMAQFNLHNKAMRPGYGLAEASLIVSSCEPLDGVIEHCVHREYLHIGDQIKLLDDTDPNAVRLVDCGKIFPSTEVRITDNNRQPLPDGVVGQLEIRGGNVTSRYYNNVAATERAINSDGWLNTEDLAFFTNGRLVFASRIKEMIIIGGVNYFPHDIEKAILRVKGDDALNTYIACSLPHPEQEGEQLVVFVYYKRKPEDFVAQAEEVRNIVMRNFDIPVSYVVPTKLIPKTTSGKVQRYVLKKRFMDGEFDEVLALSEQPRQLSANELAQENQAQEQLIQEQQEHEKPEREQAAAAGTKASSTTINTGPQLQHIAQWIHEFILNEIKQTELDNDASFFDLGIASMRLIAIQESIETHFNVVLSAVSALEFPTVNGLATCVFDELHSQSEKSTGSEASADSTEHTENTNSADEAQQNAFATTATANTNEPIAIIGMSCRFPGNANTPEDFWQMLASGTDPVGPVDTRRWPMVDNADLLAVLTTREGGFLSQPEQFDPHFFGISPTETESLDPQQRLLLEVTHNAFEHAGFSVPALRGTDTAVYVGISGSDYLAVGQAAGHNTGAYSYTGTMFNTAAGRIAWAFDLKGPCVALDTACSSSLTAVYQGMKDLQTRNSDLALATAVNIMTTPDGHVCFSHMNALSATGRSRSFDDAADGYIRSEGCAAVVLKRLSDACRDGDNIWAVIKGGAINHNGHSGGLTVPSGAAQEQLIRKAQQNANVTPAQIDFIEAHGSGTKLGDPQEASALGRVFGSTGKPILVGAVKSNIGHTEAAAGMAGLQKVVLSLKHGHIPPNLHFNTPNHLINWQQTPIKVVDTLTAINIESKVVTAGITSLGISGSNAHMILSNLSETQQEWLNDYMPDVRQMESHLVTLSAKSPASLCATLENFANADLSGMALPELARATQFQRADYGARYATLVSSTEQLQTKLGKYLQKHSSPSALSVNPVPPRVVFVFTGQGSHYLNMADALYWEFPVFRDALTQCDSAFAAHLSMSVIEAIYGDDNAPLKDSANAQAIIFSVEYALATLWMSLGVKPELVVGHSIGEYAAACIAGVVSFNDAVRMVAARGKVMNSNGVAGKMVGILASISTVESLIAEFDKVWIAAVNTPENVTISGDIEQVDAVIANAKKQRLFTEKLAMHHPFHSPMMADSAATLGETLSAVSFANPTIPLLSTQTGQVITSASEMGAMGKEYWSQHLCQPVQYHRALQALADTPANALIEMGGTATLTGLAAQVIDNGKNLFLPSQREGRESWQQFCETVAQAWMSGIAIDWLAFHGERPRPLFNLPQTGFNRSAWWYQPVTDQGANLSANTAANTTANTTGNAAMVCNVPSGQVSSQDPNTNQAATLSEPVSSAQLSYGTAQIKQEVGVMIAQITGVDESELADDFNLFALGVDSLMLVQLDKRIVARWGVEITLAQFFSELHTPESLAQHIDAAMGDDVRAALSPQLQPEPAILEPAPAEPVAASHASAQAPAMVSTMQTAPVPVVPAVNAGDMSATQQIVQQQLQLMQQQLALLNGTPTQISAQINREFSETPTQNSAQTSAQINRELSRTPTQNSPQNANAQSANPQNINASRDIVLVEDELTEQQRDFVKTLSDELIARTPQSKANAQAHRHYFADWISTLNFTLSTKEFTYPLVAERSKGSRFWDIDGNEYIDTAMGYGTCLFGHNPDFVKQPMQAQLEKGIELGPQSAIAGEVAGLMKELTGCERVAFANTGTEAVMVAIRLARTVTKRKKIVRFVTSFHGSFDGVLADMGENGSEPMTAGIIDSMIQDTIVLQYATEKSLKAIADQAGDIAAVLVEPVQSRKPGLQPKAYLQQLRALTEQHGIALVFDEMVTGFRCHPGGAQQYFDVRADLVTYGKIVGGGMPIGVIAGHTRYMNAIDGGYWQFGDASAPGAETTFFAGTFCKHPLTMVAAKAVLERVKQQGSLLQHGINELTRNLVDRLNAYFTEQHVPISMACFASMYRFESGVSADMPRLSLEMNLFFRLMQLKGIFVWERRTCFFSDAHNQQDSDAIFNAVVWATEQLRAGGFSFRKAGAPDPQDPNKPNGTTAKNSNRPLAAKDLSAARLSPQEPTQAQMQGQAKTQPEPKEEPEQITLSAVSSEEGRMFVLSQMQGGDLAYRISGAVQVTGELNISRVHQVFGLLAARHPVLRSSYRLQGRELVRDLVPEADFAPVIVEEHLAIDSHNSSTVARAVNLAVNRVAQDPTPFNVSQAPLWRIRLVHLDLPEQASEQAQQQLLVFEFHHMVADGMSVSILLEDFIALYASEEVSVQNSLAPVPASYQDFIAWERHFVGSDTFKQQLHWWQQTLSPLPEPLNLPTDRRRTGANDFAGASYNLVIDQAHTRTMRALARELKTTPFMLLYGLFSTLMYSLSRQQDLCIGIPFDRRSNGNFERTVGMFAQTLAIRTHIDPAQHFNELITQVVQQCSSAYTHCNMPLEYIVEALEVPRDISRNPLFDTMFIYETGDRRLQQAGNLAFAPCQVDIAGASFDLTLEITDQNDCLYCNFIYATRLFDEATIARWAQQYIDLLVLFAARPERPISDATTLSPAAVTQQLEQFNSSDEAFSDVPFTEQFLPVAQQHSKQLAIQASDAELSYQQLLEQSAKLAHVLIAKGVTPEQQVAILLPRTSSLIVAMLAVLRTGAAYIPLDPDYPAERVNYMLDHAKVSILIGDPELYASLNGSLNTSGLTLINPNKIRAVAANRRKPLPAVQPAQLAYVIYTSGSTGKPKGVMINHGAFASFITSIAQRLDWPDNAKTLGLTTVSFDIFVLEVFVTLLRGGTLVLANETQQQDPAALASLIATQNVNVVQLTPSRLQLLANATDLTESLRQVERILIGGEAFPAELLPKLQQLPNLQIYNVYGPTEATVWACVKNLTSDNTVTLGNTLANTQAYVLSEADQQLMPLGNVGELYLAGECLANGYLFDQEKTDAAFVPNPFKPGALMYKTGDLAAWNTQGELVYHGRNDHQIKLRGYRIELAEIDTVLNNCPEVAQGAVVVRHLSAHNPSLVAFCIAAGQQKFDQFESRVRSQLRQLLPDYMVPGLIIELDELPLTPNGKIDRKRLPSDLSSWQLSAYANNEQDESADSGKGENGQSESEQNEIVHNIREVWQQLLGHNQISRDVSYFDVGGNSFSLMLMHNELEQLWPGLIQVTDIFANPTIGALADLVSERVAQQTTADYQPLSLSAECFDTSNNHPDQEGQLLVEPGSAFTQPLHALAQHYQVSATDILIGLQAFFLHKRFNHEQVTLYLAVPGKGYCPIALDFAQLSQIEAIFTQVNRQRSTSNTVFAVPPEADRPVQHDCLFLVRQAHEPASSANTDSDLTASQHKRFDFQLIIDNNITDKSKPQSLALRVECNYQRLAQQACLSLINDYVRLCKAIIVASLEGVTS